MQLIPTLSIHSWLLIIGVFLALQLIHSGILTLAFLRKIQVLKNLTKKQTQCQLQIQQARDDLRAVTGGAIGIGTRLLKVENQLRNTVERQNEIEQRDPGDQPYVHAAKLVEMGASVEDVVENCGLSKAEAELVMVLHSPRTDEQ